jgi:hypothetical protein
LPHDAVTKKLVGQRLDFGGSKKAKAWVVIAARMIDEYANGLLWLVTIL